MLLASKCPNVIRPIIHLCVIYSTSKKQDLVCTVPVATSRTKYQWLPVGTNAPVGRSIYIYIVSMYTTSSYNVVLLETSSYMYSRWLPVDTIEYKQLVCTSSYL